MPRVVPSQVVALIDKLFRRMNQTPKGKVFKLTATHSYAVVALLDLLEQIPSELIVLKPEQYSEYISSKAALRNVIRQWETLPSFQLGSIPGLPPLSPVTLIRRALEDCPDEIPDPGTAALNFILDNDLREGLRKDISAVNGALNNGEWKAATILAGSVIEALLLWSLQQSPLTNVTSAAEELVKANTLKRKPSTNLEDWFLPELIEVAAYLNLIKDDAAVQTRLAKDYRNLIHPGRSQRLGQICDRGTALAAVAALERVVTDLSP